MRTLKFIVNDQKITPDPSCDFSNLVPGTENYVRLKFSFSSIWDNANKVVGFYSRMGKEYTPCDVSYDDACYVPREALEKRIFKIRIFGEKDGVKLKTNKVKIDQNGR